METDKHPDQKEEQEPSLSEYYGSELLDFHTGDSSAESNVERIANQAREAGGNNVLSTGMNLAGEILTLPMQLGDAAMIPMMAVLSPLQGIACLPMAAHLDPVVGIDVHFVTIPPSPAPVPLPHPYVAVIMDPKDWVAITAMHVACAAVPPPPTDASSANAAMGFQAGLTVASVAMSMKGMHATVAVSGLIPRAVAGAKNKVIPHFPLGSGFHPAFKAVKKTRGMYSSEVYL